jgi:hypothetical protein
MSRVGGSRPEVGASRIGRVVWALRWKLGEIFGWDDEGTGLGGRATSLRERLPDDLRNAPAGPAFPNAPFTPVYLLDDEFAAEIANGTVHGILHIGWVADAAGGYRGQMAVLVKPNGLFGRLYMAAIKPFRYLFIYPPLIRHYARAWRELTGRSDPAHAPVTATIGWANLPADVRSRSSIDNPDYADLFTIDTDAEAGAEQWARAMFGDVASPLERLLWRGILGLRVERTRSRDLVAGVAPRRAVERRDPSRDRIAVLHLQPRDHGARRRGISRDGDPIRPTAAEPDLAGSVRRPPAARPRTAARCRSEAANGRRRTSAAPSVTLATSTCSARSPRKVAGR